jgi:hypothetical protein
MVSNQTSESVSAPPKPTGWNPSGRCIWLEAKGSESYSWVTVCGRAVGYSEQWKHCPHCGGEIAYVEIDA